MTNCIVCYVALCFSYTSKVELAMKHCKIIIQEAQTVKYAGSYVILLTSCLIILK